MRVHGVSTWAESGSGRCTEKKTRRTIITWIASTTPAAGAGAVPEQGLSRQAEQPSLFLWDVIAASPNRFLDRAFVQAYVCHCGVLLKLLDTAERLNAGASGSFRSPAALRLLLRENGVLAFSPRKND